jgi:septal ring factor EnvC (AmiA/AmiB activator)
MTNDLNHTEQEHGDALALEREAAARAAAAAADVQRLAKDRIAAAAALREAEGATALIAVRIDALAGQRRDAEAQLARKVQALAPLMPVMQRLSMFPAETLLAVPIPADQAMHGVLVLRGFATQLEQDARLLREQQAAIAKLDLELRAEAPKLEQARAVQQDRADALDRSIANSRTEETQAETVASLAEQRAADAAARARDLRGAIAAIDAATRAAEARAEAAARAAEAARQRAEARAQALAEKRGQPAPPPAAAPSRSVTMESDPLPPAKGQMTIPVSGSLLHGWGETTDDGPANGITWRPAPGARVVAPCNGRAAFAAPFRSYGQLVIIDCGGGYHAVLAGMTHLDIQAGRRLAAGEPLGSMANWEPGTTGARPTLYLELRHGAQPVNPAPWLSGRG